jgi:hypothetical protein
LLSVETPPEAIVTRSVAKQTNVDPAEEATASTSNEDGAEEGRNEETPCAFASFTSDLNLAHAVSSR